MKCQIQGCEAEASHLVDAENGSAYRLCHGHQPKQLHELASEPKSVEFKVGPGVMYAGGGMKQ